MIRNNNIQALIYSVLYIALIFFAFSLGSCSREQIGWKNTFVYFDPQKLDSIYIAEGRQDFSLAKPVKNSGKYHLQFQCDGEAYKLRLESEEPIGIPYFSGYDAIDNFEEQPWKSDGRALILEDDHLLPPKGGFFVIMISNR